MNRLARLFLTLGFIVAITMSAFSGAPPQFTFDERGNGVGPAGALPSGIAVDPFSGMPTLAYTLPFTVVAGDVRVVEPNTSGDITSDLLRFGGANNNMVFVFSENDGNDNDPADVGIPLQLQTNFASVNEVGAEGSNFADWVPPNGGSPGSPVGTGGGAVQYHFISDVPEPTVLGLAAAGSLLLLIGARKTSR